MIAPTIGDVGAEENLVCYPALIDCYSSGAGQVE